MQYKFSCVVDKDGKYKALVLQYKETVDGVDTWQVQHHVLATGDKLVDTIQPSWRPHAGVNGLIMPQWDGTAWTETANLDEITAWELEHPAPTTPSAPTLDQRTAALEAAMLAMMGGGLDV